MRASPASSTANAAGDDEQPATVRTGATRADENEQEQPDAHGPGNAGRGSSRE